jgi:hypothetical protein
VFPRPNRFARGEYMTKAAFPPSEISMPGLDTALDLLADECEKLGITPIAFIAVEYSHSHGEDTIIFQPMVRLDEADRQAFVDKVMPAVHDAMKRDGDN